MRFATAFYRTSRARCNGTAFFGRTGSAPRPFVVFGGTVTIAAYFHDRRRERRAHRLNREIAAPQVRLNGPKNEPLGIVPIQEALRMAADLDVDLVEIAAMADPPVCRLMDYGKFKYQEQKRAAEAKAKQTVIEVKEVKFRPATDSGDYNIKVRNIRRFLAEGNKVKVTLRFRGREITHQEFGLEVLNRVRDELAGEITVEQFPRLEGRQMVMMIAPVRKKAGAAAPKAAAPAASKDKAAAKVEASSATKV
jgi:translation initiation factor IF-3